MQMSKKSRLMARSLPVSWPTLWPNTDLAGGSGALALAAAFTSGASLNRATGSIVSSSMAPRIQEWPC